MELIVVVAVVMVVALLGTLSAYAYGLRARLRHLRPKFAAIELTMEGYRVLAAGTADAKLQAAGEQIVELKQQVESAREYQRKYFAQQESAVQRYHLSEQNSHAVQEICFGEIRRLVRQAKAQGVDLAVSKPLADVMAETQTEGGLGGPLGNTPPPPPALASKQGINPSQGGT